jgi:hypothetical protein
VTDRMKLTILIGLALVLGWLWVVLGSEEGLLGASGDRGGLSAPPYTSEDIPLIVFKGPDEFEGERFDRPDRNLFNFEKSPEELADEEARRLEAQRLADETAEAKAKRDEEARLKRAAAAEAAARKKALDDAARRASELTDVKLPPPRPRPDAPPAPIPPAFPYEFEGLIGPLDDAIAILRTGEEKLAYARAGQVMDATFKIERVGQVMLVLSFIDPVFEGELRQVQLRHDQAAPGLTAKSLSTPKRR